MRSQLILILKWVSRNDLLNYIIVSHKDLLKKSSPDTDNDAALQALFQDEKGKLKDVS